jgi:predicted RNA-binding protein with RPS1 domain
MNGVTFTEYIGELPAGFDRGQGRKLEALLEQEASLAHLLRNRADLGSLPVPVLADLADRSRAFRRFRTEVLKSPLGRDAAWAAGSVAALRMAEEVAAGASGAAPGLLAECARAVLALALKEGRVEAIPVANAPEDALALAGSFAAADLPSQKWLAWRRIEKTGGLEIRMSLAEDVVSEQVQARGTVAMPGKALVPSALFSDLTGRMTESLPGAMRLALDEKAQHDARTMAAAAYRGLLTRPALREAPVGCLFVGAERQPLGAALLDREGEVLEWRSFPVSQGWEPALLDWVQRQQAAAWVVPSGALDSKRLAAIGRLLASATVAVRPAGLAAARAIPGGERLSREVLSAAILGRRAQRPLDEWSAVDPLELGLAEYQHDLDERPLRERLADVLAAVLHEREAGRGGTATRPDLSVEPAAGRLNPLIRTLADLRPGMVLDVQVTNLASFGAFVAFGLDTEGLIHISQLSDRRIMSPAEVVAIGQRLRARVTELDLQRNRVGFTLRQGDSGPQSRSPKGKADALRKLDELFRKG